jgi:hypothetical protein
MGRSGEVDQTVLLSLGNTDHLNPILPKIGVFFIRFLH